MPGPACPVIYVPPSRCAAARCRTEDPLIFSQVLYQLSYRGIRSVGDTGLEPVNLLGVSEALSQLS